MCCVAFSSLLTTLFICCCGNGSSPETPAVDLHAELTKYFQKLEFIARHTTPLPFNMCICIRFFFLVAFMGLKATLSRVIPLLSVLPELKVPLLCQQRYTPLVFFKVPPGLIPECDAMEIVVSQVEKELGVLVQRLDILRDPSAEAALAVLTKQRRPPFLYHRESCQVVHVPSRSGGDKSGTEKASAPLIDKERVRAWAKGRYLPPASASSAGSSSGVAPKIISQEDRAIDQDELLEDERLTPLQRRGKKAIRERTTPPPASSKN